MRRLSLLLAVGVILSVVVAYAFMRQPQPQGPASRQDTSSRPAPARLAREQAGSSTAPLAAGPAEPHLYGFGKYRQILVEFVNDKGLVDYGRLKRQRSQIKEVLNDLAQLATAQYRDWSKSDQIAFWINAYNIQALKIITDNYPIQGSRWLVPIYGRDSIRHIKGLKTEYKFLVMDEQFTLAELENRIFHQQFQDPRVFLALTTMSLSGPALRTEPYCGSQLDEQLNDQARRFLSDPKGLQVDREKSQVWLSALFQATWHGEDFIRDYGINRKFKDQPPYLRAVMNFACPFLGDVDRDFLEVGNYSVGFIPFDWTVNDDKRR